MRKTFGARVTPLLRVVSRFLSVIAWPFRAARRLTASFFGAWIRSWFRFAFWLALTAVAVLGINRIPQGLVALVTMTVDARTEVFSFEADGSEGIELPLPVGQYVLFSGHSEPPCDETERFRIVCAYSEPTTVHIIGDADIELSIRQPERAQGELAFPRMLVRLTPRDLDGGKPAFVIKGDSNRVLAESAATIDYESAPVRLWRAQLDISNVTLGRVLPQSTVAEPMVTEGRVRFFARIGNESAGRFLIKTEDLDPEDVVTLEVNRSCTVGWRDLWPPSKNEGECLVRLDGPVTLGDTVGTIPSAFHVTLHTNQSMLGVTRPRGGHVIRVSNWEIVSEQPALLALWGAFISLMLIVTYVEGHKAAEFARVNVEEDHEESRFRRSRRLRRTRQSSRRGPQED